MQTIWFCLIAIMIAMYVVLDGFDLGAGAIHLLVAKTEAERHLVVRSIGPVWNGNEVWLLAAGDLSGNEGFTRIAGWEGLLCGLSAMYLGIAQVLNESFGRTVLPVGPRR